MKQKYDVFISSKSSDYSLAEELRTFLINNGKNAFLASKELQRIGESEYGKVIDEALDQCHHMIVISTSIDNIKSKWVYYEWSTFSNDIKSGYRTGNLITILGGDIKLRDLPASLRHQQSFFISDYKAGILDYLRPYDNKAEQGDDVSKDDVIVGGESKLANKAHENTKELVGIISSLMSRDNLDFVDLGLSSGTLWKKQSEEGLLTFSEANRKYAKQLPTPEQFHELMAECNWIWEGNGYKIIGRNRNSIRMEAQGYLSWGKLINQCGHYWTNVSSISLGQVFVFTHNHREISDQLTVYNYLRAVHLIQS